MLAAGHAQSYFLTGGRAGGDGGPTWWGGGGGATADGPCPTVDAKVNDCRALILKTGVWMFGSKC
jgi:hypothetical protein